MTSVACEALLVIGAYAAGSYHGYQGAINSLTPKAAINASPAINGPINATGLMTGP